jgi:hypothetical protein
MSGLTPGRCLPIAKPTLEIGSVRDAEHEQHAILDDDVVHHSVIGDAYPMEYIMRSTDGLDCLASDASRAGDVER